MVVGGGVMGASAAYHLASRGLPDVVLVEREPFLGQMSTGQCAGGIRHQFASEVNVRLSIESIRMLERFPEELGQDIGLWFSGYVFLLTEKKDVAAFEPAVRLQRSLGIDTKWLSPDEVAELAPLLDTSDVIAATFYERDGLCDPASVVQGYAAGARRAGARTITDCEVLDITARSSGFSLKTARGSIEAPVLVDAAGAWAPEIGAMVGVDIPIQPIRRQMMVTDAIPGLPRDFPFSVFFADSLYFHREGRGILTGRSNVDETPGYKMEIDPDWELVALEGAVKRMPALEDAGIRSRWAGLYEVTPDAHPIFGPISTVENLYVMAGFSGHGFMHGPIAGRLMAEAIVDGGAHTVDVSSFSYERFLTGDLHPEYNVI